MESARELRLIGPSVDGVKAVPVEKSPPPEAKRSLGTMELIMVTIKDNLLIVLLILAMALGIGVGMAMRLRPERYSPNELLLIKFPGSLLLGMLQLTIIPLIVSSLVSGITTLDPRVFAKIGKRAVVYYLTTTFMAVVLGIVLVVTIKPGSVDKSAEDESLKEEDDADQTPTWATLVNLVNNMFPDNIVEVAFRMTVPQVKNSTDNKSKVVKLIVKDHRTNMLGIVVIAVVMAGAMNGLGKLSQALKDFMLALNEVSIRIVTWIIWYSPIGVMFLIIHEVIKITDPKKMFSEVAYYSLTVLLGLFIHGFITLPLVYFVVVHKNPFTFMKGVSTALVTALATASSLGTLPVTMHALEVNNGIDRRIIDFVAPVGANLNMDGTALYEAVATIFIGQKFGKDLSFAKAITVSLTATLAAVGAAGVPQAGLVTMVIVLSSVNYPTSGIAFILAVDWFLDRFRTCINVLGDAYGAGIVYHLSKAELDSLEPYQIGYTGSSELHVRGGCSAPESSFVHNTMHQFEIEEYKAIQQLKINR